LNINHAILLLITDQERMLARSQKLPAQESDCHLEPQNIQQNLPSMSMGIKLENNRCLTQKFIFLKFNVYIFRAC